MKTLQETQLCLNYQNHLVDGKGLGFKLYLVEMDLDEQKACNVLAQNEEEAALLVITEYNKNASEDDQLTWENGHLFSTLRQGDYPVTITTEDQPVLHRWVSEVADWEFRFDLFSEYVWEELRRDHAELEEPNWDDDSNGRHVHFNYTHDSEFDGDDDEELADDFMALLLSELNSSDLMEISEVTIQCQQFLEDKSIFRSKVYKRESGTTDFTFVDEKVEEIKK